MTRYEKLRDSLICEKNGEINNTAYAVICALANKNNGYTQEEKIELTEDLVTALLPNDISLSEDMVDVNEILIKLKSLISAFNINGSIEWNMNQIAEVTQAVESMLAEKTIDICHPFFMQDNINKKDKNYDEENDGVLCCMSCDKCSYCPELTDNI